MSSSSSSSSSVSKFEELTKKAADAEKLISSLQSVLSEMKFLRSSAMEMEASFLGQHTMIPRMLRHECGRIATMKNGQMPPFIIVTGHRERVKQCALKYLDSFVLCSDLMRSFGLQTGRTEVVIGLYKGSPIVIAEHMMGGPATEILIRELLSPECMTTHFNTDDHTSFHTDAKYLIRIGTCGGINSDTLASSADDPFLEPADLLVTSHQVGLTGADIQALTSCVNPLDAHAYFNRYTDHFIKLGYRIESRKKVTESSSSLSEEEEEKKDESPWPVKELDKELADTLKKQAQRIINESDELKDKSIHVFNGGNHSKDSLYVEKFDKEFMKLRKNEGVLSSEMELSTLTRVSAEMTLESKESSNPDHTAIKVGCILQVLGVIPGASFASEMKANPSDIAHVQWLSALETLHSISLQFKTVRS